ncbi:MAG TPA: diguanylate cyclase [Gemmataceae bacterium]|nr:diguanylate cyclase [Gemmataceae bacterium]
MPDTPRTRRVAVVARGEPTVALCNLFRAAPLQPWESFLADSCDQARFLLQMGACDVLVADQSILDPDRACLDWLTARFEVPVLFVSEDEPDVIAQALTQGVRQWLPRPITLSSPALLAAALRRAVLDSVTAQRIRRTDDQLGECRSQVARLVNLLWDATPVEGRPRWFSQRYMLERLQEEVCRSARHGGPLSIVLGEVWLGQDNGFPRFREPLRSDSPTATQISCWTAERVHRAKRGCDVAGQYGPQGFMLLLPHTPLEGAAHVCRRLQGLLEETPPSGAPALSRLMSCFGIAGYAPEARSSRRLLRQAEEQLEQARTARLGDE